VTAGLSWNTVKWAFTTFEAANWHPLTWLVHAADYKLFGVNPAGHHFISVLLHALNAILIFLLLQRITGCTWRSLAVAALFAVHPLNVESVAWAAELKTVLSMVFFLLALWTYCACVRKPSLVKYFSVAAIFALALMSKPQVITFPFALLLLDYWPLGRTEFSPLPEAGSRVTKHSVKWLIAEKLPFLALSAGSAMVTLYAQRTGHAVRTVVEFSLASRIENAVVSYLWYAANVFFPWHLAAIYPHAAGVLPAWEVLLATVVLGAVSVLTVVTRRRAPYLLFGWLWFLGTLVPMIGLIQVGEQARADRYMYLPVTGILIAIVWAIAEVIHRRKLSTLWGVVLSLASVTALSADCYRQVGFWRNSETLWHHTLAVTGPNFMAEDNLAQELARQGRTKEAMVHFQRTLALYDWGPLDLIAFGSYEQHHGYSADAIKQYQRALPKTTDPATRATELSNMGSAYLDTKDIIRAAQSFEQALQADPRNVPALIGTGLVAQSRGDLDQATRQYRTAVSIRPGDFAYILLGRALQQNGKISEADDAYHAAHALSKNFQDTQSAVDHLLAEVREAAGTGK
jgi:tetratricopeptide (TPR) repeat protein